jgi:hypothetical protein
MNEREMIQRAINQASARHASDCRNGIATPRPRWEIVKAAFGYGSNKSDDICWEYGYDPDEIVGEKEVDEFLSEEGC